MLYCWTMTMLLCKLESLRAERDPAMLGTADMKLIGVSRLDRISVMQHCKFDNLAAKD